MTPIQLFGFIIGAMSFLCIFAAIGMTFYLGRTKMKEIDKLVYGFEIPSDSIFFMMQRMSHYVGPFVCRWCAKRSGSLYIRDHFDKKFQRPFIITHYLFVIGGSLMILAVVLDKFFLQVT